MNESNEQINKLPKLLIIMHELGKTNKSELVIYYAPGPCVRLASACARVL